MPKLDDLVDKDTGLPKSLDTPDDVWERTIELNLYSTVRCSRAFARAMVDGGVQGSIINVASPAGGVA